MAHRHKVSSPLSLTEFWTLHISNWKVQNREAAGLRAREPSPGLSLWDTADAGVSSVGERPMSASNPPGNLIIIFFYGKMLAVPLILKTLLRVVTLWQLILFSNLAKIRPQTTSFLPVFYKPKAKQCFPWLLHSFVLCCRFPEPSMYRSVARERKSIGCLDNGQDSTRGWAEGRDHCCWGPLSPGSTLPAGSVTGLWPWRRPSSRVLTSTIIWENT